MRYLLSSLIAAAGLFADQSFAQTSNPCADIAAAVSPKVTKFDAKQAVDCLRSVPFDQKAALTFIGLYNVTNLQMQSTTTYLKDPPSSYQQPAADLNDALNVIQTKVKNGTYSNEYDFEADLQALVHSSHDNHMGLQTGALSVFRFKAPMALASVSDNGQNLPQVFAVEDLLAKTQNKASFTPSPLKQINGRDAVEYLKDWASKYQGGYSEPHAEWNSMMTSAMNTIRGNDFGWAESRVFSDEYLNVTFANGTAVSRKWTAEVASKMVGDLQTVTDGDSFYKRFVASQSLLSSGTSSSTTTTTTNTRRDGSLHDARHAVRAAGSPSPSASALARWPVFAFPPPSLVQPGLHLPIDDGSFLTGYLVKDASLAVLSIPSFSAEGAFAQQFSKTVSDFIRMAQNAKAQNVLFDVRGNGGGDPLLAYEAYKQFFPAAKPFSGARGRVNALANALGKANSDVGSNMTEEQLDAKLKSTGASPWLAQLYNDAVTGQQFTSWENWLQPNNVQEKGDSFTKPFVLDFDRTDFDRQFSGGNSGIVLDGFGNRAGDSQNQQPFATQNIAILADGLCTSTCTVFVELFHHQAGVKVVVAGGRPATGPMQGAAGSRGAQSYHSTTQLNTDIQRVLKNNSAALDNSGLSLGSDSDSNPTVRWLSGGFNLWDQVRIENGKATIPLQFTYNAANCRIFYTADTFNNYTALWTYAANAVFKDVAACVPGSTGQPSAGNVTDTTGPTATTNNAATPNTGSGAGNFKTDPSGSPAPGGPATKSGGAKTTVVGGGVVVSLVIPCLVAAIFGFP